VDTICGTHGGQEKCIQVSGGDLNERHHLDDLDGRITLNIILNISMVGCELDIFRQVCFKHRTEPFGSIKCGKDRCLPVELLPFQEQCYSVESVSYTSHLHCFLLYLISIKGF
jgi:hypothetical protein